MNNILKTFSFNFSILSHKQNKINNFNHSKIKSRNKSNKKSNFSFYTNSTCSINNRLYQPKLKKISKLKNNDSSSYNRTNSTSKLLRNNSSLKLIKNNNSKQDDNEIFERLYKYNRCNKEQNNENFLFHPDISISQKILKINPSNDNIYNKLYNENEYRKKNLLEKQYENELYWKNLSNINTIKSARINNINYNNNDNDKNNEIDINCINKGNLIEQIKQMIINYNIIKDNEYEDYYRSLQIEKKRNKCLSTKRENIKYKI